MYKYIGGSREIIHIYIYVYIYKKICKHICIYIYIRTILLIPSSLEPSSGVVTEIYLQMTFSIPYASWMWAVPIQIPNRKQNESSLSGMFCQISFIPNHFLENRNRNRFVPVTFECVTICDIWDQNMTKSVLPLQKLKKSTACDRGHTAANSKLWNFVTVTNGHTFHIGWEEFCPSGPEWKNQLKKVRRNQPKITRMLTEKIMLWEIVALWKLVVWASRAWWRCEKLEHLCQTGGHDSLYSFIGANARFGGANACYRPLRHHSDFWGRFCQMVDHLCFPVIPKIECGWYKPWFCFCFCLESGSELLWVKQGVNPIAVRN